MSIAHEQARVDLVAYLREVAKRPHRCFNISKSHQGDYTEIDGGNTPISIDFIECIHDFAARGYLRIAVSPGTHRVFEITTSGVKYIQ